MSKLAYRPEEAAELASLSRSTLYEFMQSGELEFFKVGRARLISHAALVDLMQRLAQKAGSSAAS